MQAHVVPSVGMGAHAQGHLGDSAGRRSTTSIELCTHGATSQSELPRHLNHRCMAQAESIGDHLGETP